MIVNIFLPGNNTRTKKNSKGSEVKVDYGAEEAAEEAKEEEVKTVFKLAEEDVEFIYDNTHYTLKDIKDWHRSATATENHSPAVKVSNILQRICQRLSQWKIVQTEGDRSL